MNRQALIKRKVQLEYEREAELRACRAKWRSRISSVDRSLMASPRTDDGSPPTPTSSTSRGAIPMISFERKIVGDRKTEVLKLVRQTLRRHRGFFTTKSLVEFIRETRHYAIAESDIGHSLRTLHKLGEILIVEKGRGRKANLYFKF